MQWYSHSTNGPIVQLIIPEHTTAYGITRQFTFSVSSVNISSAVRMNGLSRIIINDHAFSWAFYNYWFTLISSCRCSRLLLLLCELFSKRLYYLSLFIFNKIRLVYTHLKAALSQTIRLPNSHSIRQSFQNFPLYLSEHQTTKRLIKTHNWIEQNATCYSYLHYLLFPQSRNTDQLDPNWKERCSASHQGQLKNVYINWMDTNYQQSCSL